MKIAYKHTNKLYVNMVYSSTFTGMTIVQNFPKKTTTTTTTVVVVVVVVVVGTIITITTTNSETFTVASNKKILTQVGFKARIICA
jgi:hypothetical protein